jgi:regulator of protease activity HflC (stomatin/prohibitin superfamily)
VRSNQEAYLIFILVVIIIALALAGLRVVNQYQRGVVLRLGRLQDNIKQPGLTWILPFIDKMQKVSMRIITLPVDSQKIITRDNVSIDVAAVAYYQLR